MHLFDEAEWCLDAGASTSGTMGGTWRSERAINRARPEAGAPVQNGTSGSRHETACLRRVVEPDTSRARIGHNFSRGTAGSWEP